MLTKKELSVLMRRCLNITLKQVELDALFECMDVDKSNLIDGVEFTRYFIDLGNKARAFIQKEKHEVLRRKIELSKRNEEKVAERLKKKLIKFSESENKTWFSVSFFLVCVLNDEIC